MIKGDFVTISTGQFGIKTKGELDIIDITANVEDAVESSGIKEGIALVHAGHTTGILVLNEDEPNLLEDLRRFLRQLIPKGGGYLHRENGYAHLRSMLMQPSRIVPTHNGKLGLVTWQSIYWVEADNASRDRRIEVIMLGK